MPGLIAWLPSVPFVPTTLVSYVFRGLMAEKDIVVLLLCISETREFTAPINNGLIKYR